MYTISIFIYMNYIIHTYFQQLLMLHFPTLIISHFRRDHTMKEKTGKYFYQTRLFKIQFLIVQLKLKQCH